MDGGKFQQLVGSRRQVFNGTAKKTNYGKNGLEKKDLKMNKHGLIVSAKKSKTAKKAKHLGKFLQKRGSKTFGPRKTAKKTKGGEVDNVLGIYEKDFNRFATGDEKKTYKGMDWATFKNSPEWMVESQVNEIKERLAQIEEGKTAEEADKIVEEKHDEELRVNFEQRFNKIFESEINNWMKLNFKDLVQAELNKFSSRIIAEKLK